MRHAARSTGSVHPRVGGEHSSKARRNQRGLECRFIPAWAGNTIRRALWRSAVLECSVHPRVGGEHGPAVGRRPGRHRRFIPAWAGNTHIEQRLKSRSRLRFIPAWAGNTNLFRGREFGKCRFGSSPRGRGTQLEDAHGAQSYSTSGSSPRGRGTQGVQSTPAILADYPVHPRVGGEHVSLDGSSRSSSGSSPRGRGTRHRARRDAGTLRFIPAWAGNTSAPSILAVQVGAGSSPRGRGTHSPRHPASFELARRFIPAWAGNTCTGEPREAVDRRRRFIPAWAGNTSKPKGTAQPRSRRFIPAWAGNTVGDSEAAASALRFIPAWAGNTTSTRRLSLKTLISRFIPAWAGNTRRRSDAACAGKYGSSPRGRGTLSGQPRRIRASRFIPAWAGNTPSSAESRAVWTVHPRVGGEHAVFSRVSSRLDGSSPRGRGTLGDSEAAASALRFIPAWAGNTINAALSLKLITVHPAWAGNTRGDLRRGAGKSVHPRVGGEHGAIGQTSATCPTGRFIPAWAGNT